MEKEKPIVKEFEDGHFEVSLEDYPLCISKGKEYYFSYGVVFGLEIAKFDSFDSAVAGYNSYIERIDGYRKSRNVVKEHPINQ